MEIFSKTAYTHCVTITILPSRPRFYVWNLVSVFLRVEPCLDFTPVVIISLRPLRNPLGILQLCLGLVWLQFRGHILLMEYI